MTDEQLQRTHTLALCAAILRAGGFLPANSVAAAHDILHRVVQGRTDGRLYTELTDEEKAALKAIED